MSKITATSPSSLLESYLAGSDTCERGRLIRIQYYWRNRSFMYAFWSKWTRDFHITCKYTVFWRSKKCICISGLPADHLPALRFCSDEKDEALSVRMAVLMAHSGTFFSVNIFVHIMSTQTAVVL